MKPAYAYPSHCGSEDAPAWICFGVYDKNITSRGNLLTTIGLMMPEKASMPSTVSWENESIGFRTNAMMGALSTAIDRVGGADAIMASMEGGYSSFNRMASGINAELSTAMKSSIPTDGGGIEISSGLADAAASYGVDKMVGMLPIRNQDGGSFSTNQTLGMTTGTIRNPYLTAMFRGVDFRSFEFSFNFFPHNEDECNTIHDIIKILRMAHLPDYYHGGGQGSYLFKYPLEFDIVYKWGADDNPYIHKFKPSVLTAIETNFTGYGTWVSMRNGMPASITLDLRFTELDIVTRTDVDEGF